MAEESRTTYPGAEATGDVLTAANFDKLPGGWLGYLTTAFNVLAGGTEQDLLSGTFTVSAGASRLLKITAAIAFDAASGTGTLSLKQGTTYLATNDFTSKGMAYLVALLATDTAGDQSFDLVAKSCTGGPVTLIVEDIGPAPA